MRYFLSRASREERDDEGEDRAEAAGDDALDAVRGEAEGQPGPRSGTLCVEDGTKRCMTVTLMSHDGSKRCMTVMRHF